MNEFAQLRQKAGLSIAEAAETIGWSASTVYRWDRGEQIPRRAAIDTLRRVIADRVADEPAEAGFSFIDLFAGIGGMRRGFEGIGGRCVYTSEWNTWSQTTYRANFPGDSHPDCRATSRRSRPKTSRSMTCWWRFSVPAVFDCRCLQEERARTSARVSLRRAGHALLRCREDHRAPPAEGLPAGERQEPAEPRQGQHVPRHPAHAEGGARLSRSSQGHRCRPVRATAPRAHLHRRHPRLGRLYVG